MPATTAHKATHNQTRRANERLVLRTIFEDGPLSRADVARATALTRTTVSDVVEDLIADGLVAEAGTGPSTGGKAPILLRVPSDARQLIGIDVDQERISGVVIDLKGDVQARASRVLDGRDGDEARDALDEISLALVDAAQRPLVGIGVGAPGLIDTATGTVRWAVGLDWRDEPTGPHLTGLTGLPVIVVNDSQAAAMAEWAFGRHENFEAMVVVKVGEGIGAGIVLGGRLYPGDDSGAGEIGHTRVSDDDAPCRCGSSGCLETLSSLRAVLSRAREAARTRDGWALAGRTVSHEALLEAFRGGDPVARDIVLESAVPLGRVIGAMIGTLGARDFVLVGPMAAYGEPWLCAVRGEARRSALPLLAERATIHIGRTGDDVVELGAAAMLMTSRLGLALAA